MKRLRLDDVVQPVDGLRSRAAWMRRINPVLRHRVRRDLGEKVAEYMYGRQHLAESAFDLEVLDEPDPDSRADPKVVTLGDPEVIKGGQPTSESCARCLATDVTPWRTWSVTKPFYLFTARWQFARSLLRLISLTMLSLCALILVGLATPGDARDIMIAMGGLLLVAQPVLMVCLGDSGLTPLLPEHHPACPHAPESSGQEGDRP